MVERRISRSSSEPDSSWVDVDETSVGPLEPLKWVVICSPVSGRKVGREVVEQELVPAWKRALGQLPLEVCVTEYHAHATELAKQHGNASCGLIVVGGDGTIRECIEGLLEAGTLQETRIACLSQGSLNFFAVTSGLAGVQELPDSIARGFCRPSSLIKVCDNSGALNTVSFEALHIGSMPFRVTKGARDWRLRPGGPLVGVFKELISCNLLPSLFSECGTLELQLASGSKRVVQDNFYWIIASHRNPYTGVVGPSMWVSYMSLNDFPGFGRMMAFFAPPMEHYSGIAYSQPVYECTSFQYTTANPGGSLGVVLDGDSFRAGPRIKCENQISAWNLVASPKRPDALKSEFIDVDYITPAAARFLRSNPPPLGTVLHHTKRTTPVSSQSLPSLKRLLLVLVLALLFMWRRRQQLA